MRNFSFSVKSPDAESFVTEVTLQEESFDAFTVQLSHEEYPFLAEWKSNDWDNFNEFMTDVPTVTDFPLEQAFVTSLQMFEQAFRKDGDTKPWRLIGH